MCDVHPCDTHSSHTASRRRDDILRQLSFGSLLILYIHLSFPFYPNGNKLQQ